MLPRSVYVRLVILMSTARTELLLDDLENLLLVELLGKALDGGQSLTTIAF